MGGVGDGLGFVSNIPYELTKDELAGAVMGYPGLIGMFKGSMLGVLDLVILWGKDFPVLAYGCAIGLHSWVNLDGECFCTLLHHNLEHVENAV